MQQLTIPLTYERLLLVALRVDDPIAGRLLQEEAFSGKFCRPEKVVLARVERRPVGIGEDRQRLFDQRIDRLRAVVSVADGLHAEADPEVHWDGLGGPCGDERLKALVFDRQDVRAFFGTIQLERKCVIGKGLRYLRYVNCLAIPIYFLCCNMFSI